MRFCTKNRSCSKNQGTSNANPSPSEAKQQRQQSVLTVAVVLAFRSVRLFRGVSVAEGHAHRHDMPCCKFAEQSGLQLNTADAQAVQQPRPRGKGAHCEMPAQLQQLIQTAVFTVWPRWDWGWCYLCPDFCCKSGSWCKNAMTSGVVDFGVQCPAKSWHCALQWDQPVPKSFSESKVRKSCSIDIIFR